MENSKAQVTLTKGGKPDSDAVKRKKSKTFRERHELRNGILLTDDLVELLKLDPGV